MGGQYTDRVFNLYIREDGDVFVGGGFDSYTNFKYDEVDVLDSSNPNSLAMFELHLDSEGAFKEAWGFYGNSVETSISNNNTVVLTDGKIITAGRYLGETAFLEDAGPVYNEHTVGFVMKWEPEAEPVLNIDNFTPEAEYTVYPNPFSNEINILVKDNQTFKVSVLDLSGKQVLQTQITGNNTLNVSHQNRAFI